VQILHRKTEKNPNNGTFQYNPAKSADPEYYGDVLFQGLAQVDDNRNHNPVNNEFGEQRKAGIEIYLLYRDLTLEQQDKLKDIETKLPEIIVKLNPNQMHCNIESTCCETMVEFKVVSISRPNGVRNKHIQLHCESAS
jgi:hypothetical protein